MPNPDDLLPAFRALDECDEALAALDARCCEPGRSPRMATLAGILRRARAEISRLPDAPDGAAAALALLEDAGGQVGTLQVGCCAPNRLPLYGDMLRGLTEARSAVSRALGRGH